jgi:hypothetical protein
MTLAARHARRFPLESLVAVALVGLATVVVFRGALGLYFAQDDFGGLARATGALPRHATLWRYISVQTFMDIFHPFFRDRPWPYHVVGLALHAGNAGLLYALLTRRLSKGASLVGASFFAAHPALFTALYWLSARADLLAASFALCAVLLALRPGRERWLAVAAFALSLLSKESTLPLPAVIFILSRWTADDRRPTGAKREAASRLDPLLVALFSMSACYAAYLALSREGGIRIGFDQESAYALDFGAGLLRNLLTYVGWTADIAMLRPGLRFVDRENPELFPFAIAVLVAAALLGLWPTLRRRGWLIGLGSFLLLLTPVLPLRNHAYHYYLYVPLMAAGLCVGAWADALFSLAPAPRPGTARGGGGAKGRSDAAQAPGLPWIVAGFCWLVLTWNGARLVSQMERRPSPVYPGLRGDPIVDRALIAQRAIHGLRQANIPPGTEMVFVMRERVALEARIVGGSGEEPAPSQEVYPETNMKAALFDGIGVRALVPAVDSVVFALSVERSTPRRRYAVYAPTGEVEVFDRTSIDSLLRSAWVTRW